jgi:hypothetical protein
MIALGLSEVLISNAVKEDHEDRDGYKKQYRCAERVNQYANPEPGLARGQPRYRRLERMFAQVFNGEHTEEENVHTSQPRKSGRAHRYGMAERLVPVCEQNDQEERQDGREWNKPDQ